jgi:hypothetical protein
MSTLANYGINAVFVSDFDTHQRRPDDEISQAINEAHKYGLEYHSVMMCLSETSVPPAGVDTRARLPNGAVYSDYVQCPIRAHDYALQAVQSYLQAHPNIDGLMLDHIRYAIQDICYCDQCRSAFDAWYYEHYGQHVTDWTQFYPDGPNWKIYAEWRTIPVTKLVKDIRDLVKSINPNIVLSASVWTYYSGVAYAWRLYLGQDTGYWIKEDYLDFVAPMMYTDTIYGSTGETLQSYIDTCLPYMVAGPEGKIPLVASLYWIEGFTPQMARDQVNYVRSRGLDGWIFWHYSGPGDGEPGPDITKALALINMPQTFSISNINVEVSGNTAIVTWQTDLPTTSVVEYSTSPLFIGVWRTDSDFPYWDIDHVNGTIIADNQLVTSHSIQLPNLEKGKIYYFRVQSQGSGGTVTSQVYHFSTASPENVTPWTGTLDEGTYKITMPQQVQVGSNVYNFKQWEDGSTNPVRTINLTADTTITAYYALGEYTITISATPGGTTNPVPGSYRYTAGTSVAVTAIPDSGYVFDHWILDGVTRTENPITIIMDRDYTLTAYFKTAPPVEYTLTISTTTGGTTSPTSGTYKYPAGTSITVTAIPDTNYNFSYWMLNGTRRTENPITITMDKDYTLMAVFEYVPPPVYHTLIISATSGGTTNPAPGRYDCLEGTSVTVAALPDTNYRFSHWELDGAIRTENPITITMDRDYSLRAVFEYVPPPPLTATIRGIVKDAKTTQPIAGAVVTCNGYADVTEIDGSYEFVDIPAKSYTLTVTKENYATATASVDASAGGTFTLDFELTPTPIIPPKITGPLGLWTFPLLTRLAETFPSLATLLERLKRVSK